MKPPWRRILYENQPYDDNYTDYEAGIRITNVVEYSGYTLMDDVLLFPEKGKKQHFHMTFTLEKIDNIQ